MRADNSRYLADAARQRSEQTMARARQAITEMQAAGQPVTIAAVAARARISRAWLYTQAELRQQITAHPGKAAPARTAAPASDPSLRQRLTLAHMRIAELADTNKQLRNQIATLHGQLRAATLRTASSKTPSATQDPSSES
jgi:Family of unknown function (DUF6262)